MPRIIFVASEVEKALWVEAAHSEHVTLSEWLRRAATQRAGLVSEERQGSQPPPDAVRTTGRSSDASHGSLTAGDIAEAGITTSQPGGVGRISQDAEGPKAQPSPPPAANDPKVGVEEAAKARASFGQMETTTSASPSTAPTTSTPRSYKGPDLKPSERGKKRGK